MGKHKLSQHISSVHWQPMKRGVSAEHLWMHNYICWTTSTLWLCPLFTRQQCMFLPSHMVGYSSWPRGDPLGIGEVIVGREPYSKRMCKITMLLMPMSNSIFTRQNPSYSSKSMSVGVSSMPHWTHQLKGVRGLPFTTPSLMNIFKFHQHTCGYYLNSKTRIFYD